MAKEVYDVGSHFFNWIVALYFEWFVVSWHDVSFLFSTRKDVYVGFSN